MDRLQQIAKWREEAAALKARIAAIDVDISANPMDPEVLRTMQEEYEAETERIAAEISDKTILWEPGPPVFDGRVKERNDLADELVNVQYAVDAYTRREMPDETIADEVTFAQEHGLDLPNQKN